MFEKMFNEAIDKAPGNRFGRTPFQIACEKGNVRIAELIIKKSIENNIDLNWKPGRYPGRTGFHDACTSGQVKIVELLIENAAEFNIDLNVKDDYGSTGFCYACITGHVKIVELLIKNSVELNIDLNAKDKDGSTGFHKACFWGHVEIVEFFLGHVEIRSRVTDQKFSGLQYRPECQRYQWQDRLSFGLLKRQRSSPKVDTR